MHPGSAWSRDVVHCFLLQDSLKMSLLSSRTLPSRDVALPSMCNIRIGLSTGHSWPDVPMLGCNVSDLVYQVKVNAHVPQTSCDCQFWRGHTRLRERASARTRSGCLEMANFNLSTLGPICCAPFCIELDLCGSLLLSICAGLGPLLGPENLRSVMAQCSHRG